MQSDILCMFIHFSAVIQNSIFGILNILEDYVLKFLRFFVLLKQCFLLLQCLFHTKHKIYELFNVTKKRRMHY